ncbi:MAG: hypothetical protein A2Z83_02960 [Omnitrophica bacterium GWA2_52_8]|nr:MAG: hypothetical protein A2Z83_02960 [Omnitrophica bacterium GWA2_52_8]
MVKAASPKDSGRKLFFGLFIFPLLIAVGMAVLLCSVVLLTQEDVSPESLITEIKTGSPSKRWQKAFELSNELNQGRGLIRGPGVMKEVMAILKNREEYDPKTRAYMALALSRFESTETAPFLREVLAQETDEDVQISLLWALGSKKDASAVDVILPLLEKDQPDVRKMAVYVLGVLGDPAAVPAIEKLLDDKSRDVRWNSALSLARLGSRAGSAELLKMLERKHLESQEGLDEAKIEEIMTNAARGAALLGLEESKPVLSALAESDKSLKVRQAALEALAGFQTAA